MNEVHSFARIASIFVRTFVNTCDGCFDICGQPLFEAKIKNSIYNLLTKNMFHQINNEIDWFKRNQSIELLLSKS